jgi:hypothetical protein
MNISSSAQQIILHSKCRGRKVKICWFGSGKWFWLSIIEELLGLVKGAAQQHCATADRV